jgi:hypothetical protein
MESVTKGAQAARPMIRLVPFTGGLFVVWAFFGPESYGRWLGTIVHAFRTAAGF